MSRLRPIAASFVADPATGVCVRDRLKHLTGQDETVLRAVGAYLGSLAAADLKTRIADGLGHGGEAWAARKGGLTGVSSSRWAGSITKASHDQWALSRRAQAQHIHSLQDGIAMIGYRLSQPIGGPGLAVSLAATARARSGLRSPAAWASCKTGWPDNRLTGMPGGCGWCAADANCSTPATTSMRPG